MPKASEGTPVLYLVGSLKDRGFGAMGIRFRVIVSKLLLLVSSYPLHLDLQLARRLQAGCGVARSFGWLRICCETTATLSFLNSLFTIWARTTDVFEMFIILEVGIDLCVGSGGVLTVLAAASSTSCITNDSWRTSQSIRL